MRQLLCDGCGRLIQSYRTGEAEPFTSVLQVGRQTKDFCWECIDKIQELVENNIPMYDFNKEKGKTE